jgi:hypothetical protein
MPKIPAYTVCSVDDCGRERDSAGVCRGHLYRLKTYGDVMAHKPLRARLTPAKRPCSVPGCGRPFKGRGYCKLHLERLRTYGSTEHPNPSTETCTIAECGRPHHARGWCLKHYLRWRNHDDPLYVDGTSPGEAQKYFWGVVLSHQSAECLFWPFGRNENGYGMISHEGRNWIASRLACQLVNGQPPTPDHEAAHSCGKGHLGCVNPHHVDWKTHIENMADALVHGTMGPGEKAPAAKLTDPQVREIIALKGQMLQREIAARFGIRQSQVSMIHRGKSWPHINRAA